MDLAAAAQLAEPGRVTASSRQICAAMAAATSRRAATTWSQPPRMLPGWSDRSARLTPSWSAMTGAGSSPGRWPRTHPKVVRRLAIVSMPHPLRLRAAVLSAPFAQARSMSYALGFQLPMLPERRLLKDGAHRVGRLLSAWSGPGWPDPETERRYRGRHARAVCRPFCAGVPPLVPAVQVPAGRNRSTPG